MHGNLLPSVEDVLGDPEASRLGTPFDETCFIVFRTNADVLDIFRAVIIPYGRTETMRSRNSQNAALFHEFAS